MTARYPLVLSGTSMQELQTGDSLSGSIANLSGGGSNTIVYQSAAGTTAYLTNGTTGQVLTANTGSAPTWGAGGVSAGKCVALAMIFGF